MGTPQAVPSADGVISKPSPYAVDETIRRLDEVVRGKGLTVFSRIDHRSGAREVGLDMQDEQVLIFGNPRAGTPLMVARPLVGLDLPLRVLVWRIGWPRLGQLPGQCVHRQAIWPAGWPRKERGGCGGAG